MASAETVELHLPYAVLLGDGTSLTLAMLCPAAWYFGPHMGAIGGSNIEEPAAASVRTSLRALR